MGHLEEVDGVAGVLGEDLVPFTGGGAWHPEEHQGAVGAAGSPKGSGSSRYCWFVSRDSLRQKRPHVETFCSSDIFRSLLL